VNQIASAAVAFLPPSVEAFDRRTVPHAGFAAVQDDIAGKADSALNFVRR